MIGNARGSHSSPGIYMKEVDLSYASKTLGITTLGVVGETLKGPAFEPIRIENWKEFVEYFGGTSPEKFKGTEYPKYELPYIAKSYLKNSNQLEVCRVLGLSGYNAGPAWLITAKEDATGSTYVVAVLRSRGEYGGEGNENPCEDTNNTFDTLTFTCQETVTLETYTSVSKTLKCSGEDATTSNNNLQVSKGNYGKFNIQIGTGDTAKTISVSLNPQDKDYIINKLGTNPNDGEFPLFVEELYDVAYMNKVASLDTGATMTLDVSKIEELTLDTGKYVEIKGEDIPSDIIPIEKSEIPSGKDGDYIKVTTSEGEASIVKYYKWVFDVDKNNVENYRQQFRCASTPWIVSELKGEGSNGVKVEPLFRFHTISDGDYANSEVKVSIQNIRPDEGLFDVVVRKFDDMDSTPTILERFSKCSMVPGTNNFIGFKIGTFDGEYILKSKYITVQVNINERTEGCVPAGFEGYPMRSFGTGYTYFDMGYSLKINDDIKPKKQYFGFSNNTGVDVDIFKYKGAYAYGREGEVSKGFHLDSRIADITEMANVYQYVSKDEKLNVSGNYTRPLIGTEKEMEGSIYEDINYRKFTVCFYGGFDGWDPYRSQRTNTNEFKANKYMGKTTEGSTFTQINDPESLNLVGNCITSDYYAYLAGARQFDNIEAVDINVFATPGIDYVNQSYLSKEILSMIEEERGDTLYIMTTPDTTKEGNMIYPDEAVSGLEDAEIDSSYAATYYPWVKYFDKDNSVYINLPATKDALAAMAYTDNISYPWFAPAGTVRGAVECERAAYITKLEDEDVLYEGRINPIKTFASDGVKIWGQKTMYEGDTPLNRINVRRLMLRVKKLIVGACRRLIFEQNDSTVKAQFEGLVKPILDDIKAKRGIYDYRLEVNDSAEARDRLELPAAIYIKPTKALEYIDLVFVISPESISFDDM